MADEGEEDRRIEEEIDKGEEPGASRNSILLNSESYDDLTRSLDEQLEIQQRERLPSGTIKEIVGGGKFDSLKSIGNVTDSDVSSTGSGEIPGSDSTNGSNRATPSSEISTQDDSSRKIEDLEAAVEEMEEEEIDFVHTDEWKIKKKHVFILSEAGKPIYSRYGSEEKLVTIMGVLQALVSFVQDSNDGIRYMVAGKHRFVFHLRDHLILVGVVSTKESVVQILLQLNYIYNQVLSILTYSHLNRIFKQRGNYDLRRLLTGAEKFFDNLLYLMERDPCFMLGAVRCLPLDSHTRDIISQSIAQHAKVKDLVFAIVIAENQLITLVRMKRYFLHPLDLHLVFNLIGASESFKAAESWTPICLPKFDSGGYLHAHISYLDDDCKTCLLLLTVDKDLFFTLSECKQKIQKRLIKYNCLNAISELC